MCRPAAPPAGSHGGVPGTGTASGGKPRRQLPHRDGTHTGRSPTARRREPPPWQHGRVRVVLVLRWFVVLALVAVAAVTVYPDVLGIIDDRFTDLSMRAYVAQAIAMRPLIFLGMAGLALVVLVGSLVSRVGARRPSAGRPGRDGSAPRRPD